MRGPGGPPAGGPERYVLILPAGLGPLFIADETIRPNGMYCAGDIGTRLFADPEPLK